MVFRFYYCYVCRGASFFPTDADRQQILSEIPETSFRGSGIQWLRPAVVGLLASAALVLMNSENFSSPKEDIYSFRHQLPHLPRGIYRHKEI